MSSASARSLASRLTAPVVIGERRLPPIGLVLLATVGLALLAVIVAFEWTHLNDEYAYWQAGARLWAGQALYDPGAAPNTPYAYWYPPPLAQVLAPITVVLSADAIRDRLDGPAAGLPLVARWTQPPRRTRADRVPARRGRAAGAKRPPRDCGACGARAPTLLGVLDPGDGAQDHAGARDRVPGGRWPMARRPEGRGRRRGRAGGELRAGAGGMAPVPGGCRGQGRHRRRDDPASRDSLRAAVRAGWGARHRGGSPGSPRSRARHVGARRRGAPDRGAGGREPDAVGHGDEHADRDRAAVACSRRQPIAAEPGRSTAASQAIEANAAGERVPASLQP